MKRLTDTLITTDFASFVTESHKILRGHKALNDDPYLPFTYA
jgi:hypothetical protein